MEAILTYIMEHVTSFDRSILRALYAVMNSGPMGGFLDTVMPKITILGDNGYFWIALAVILLIPKKTRRTGTAMLVAMLLGLIFCNGLIKHLVMRPRPYDTWGFPLQRDHLLIPALNDYSFPSGHTTSSVAAATAIFKDHSVWGFAAFLLALLIAFSRLYLGVHYPSDVFGGLILGFLMGLWGSSITKTVGDRMEARKKRKLAETQAEQ